MVALKDGSILLVEGKVNGDMPSSERKELVKLARKQVRGKAILAFRRRRKLLLSELSAKSAMFDRPFDPRSEYVPNLP